MSNIFFTSDLHLGHANIIKYCDRPFATVLEMNEEIIKRHNSVVGKNDIVYDLGDFCFGKDEYSHRLNGKRIRINGSHDKKCGVDMYRLFVDINHYLQLIILCHYPMRSWEKSHYGSWMLYGHHHGKLQPYGLSFDVGVDTNNFYPYSLHQVTEIMSSLKPIVDYRKIKEI